MVARLITQGFRHPDAISGALRPNSPTLTINKPRYDLVSSESDAMDNLHL